MTAESINIEPTDDNDLPTHIVGIGASAGGLEALERLFRSMPTDTGMAFVVIQHLSPDFKSLMDELLERFTSMSAIPVVETATVKPNTIYLLPPRKDLTIEGNLLISHDRVKDAPLSLPINTFFRSLAAAWEDRAIAVVLSGTGSDGSGGILDVRDAGGLVLVEAPESARFDGMPISAINTGAVDAILQPEEMPKAMRAFIDDPEVRTQFMLGDGTEQPGFPAILGLLKREYKIDFNNYKPATILRRISRRVALEAGDRTIEEYGERLAEDRAELNALYQDLLIGVTRFFRDPEAFEVLRESIVTPVIEQANEDEEVRVWVCGCSTGEEAYSIAILFLDAFAKLGRSARLKVLATDLHEESLATAAEGVYAADKFTDMPDDLRDRYFEPVALGQYKVLGHLRRCLIFSAHNVLKDPPFTRMHMVSCRNLLIYLQPPAQTRTIATLHYALRLNGVMFLGASESLGDLSDEMETLNRPYKLYRKIKESNVLLSLRSPLSMPTPARTATATGGQLPRIYDSLLTAYVPGGILVNERREILHIFGDASRFIQHAEGRFSGDVLNLVAHPISLALTTALRSAAKQRSPVVLKGILHQDEGGPKESLTLNVDPFIDRVTKDAYFMIRIAADETLSQLAEPAASTPLDLDQEAAHQVRELENELQKMRESLQSTVEELETTNEELQASNEELLASNEELQSTNEELHSVNEELYSVNAEHELKIEALNRATSDLRNLMQSTDTATIFVDTDGKLRLYTPRALEIFSLIPQDVGRELKHFKSLVSDPRLFDDIARVLSEEDRIERQIAGERGREFLRRAMVYRNAAGSQQGVVINYMETTEVMRANRALYDTEVRLKGLMDHSPAIVWIKDEQGCYTYLNRAFETRFGVRLTDWLGHTDAELKARGVAGQFQNNDQAVLDSDTPIEVEEVAREPDGRLSHWRTIKFVIQDADGARQVAGMGLDISARKQAEEALRLSELQFRQVTETLPQLVWTCTADGRCDYLSPQWRSYTGKDEAEQLGSGWLAQLHPDDRDLTTTKWMATVASGQDFAIEFRIRRHDGVYRWFRTLSVPLRDAQGEVIKWFGSNTDIDDIRQAQAALQESEERLALFIARAPAALAMFDRELRYLAASQRWLEDHGLLLADRDPNIRGQSHYDLFPETHERWEAVRHRALAGETVTNDEDRFLRRDGSEQWLRWEALPWHAANGEIGGILIFSEDVTERVVARREIEQLNCYLERRVEQRTAELEKEKRALQESQAQLYDAKRIAESANQAKSQFLATMSHEIRTPLNAIIGTSYMLGHSQLDPDQQQLLNTIEAASRGLLAQINDILDLAKIEAGEIDIEHIPFNLAALLDDLGRIFTPESHTKGIELTFPDADALQLPPLLGDANKIQQVLTNLIGNALKFTEQGSIKVELTVLERKSESVTLHIAVTDTGIGIAPDILPRLFQPFTQADASTTRLHGGTGLGLSLVRRMIERMGGQVGVKSTLGSGSTFWLRLPLGLATEENTAPNEPLPSQTLRILVADDDAAERHLLTTLGAELGWQVEAVADGKALIARLVDDRQTYPLVSCVLLDWRMPGFDGVETLAELKRRLDPMELPAMIMISVMDSEAVRKATFKANVNPDNVLVKPANPAQLFNAVNKAVAAHEHWHHVLTATRIRSNHSCWLPEVRVLVVDDSAMNLDVCNRLLRHEGAHPVLCESGARALELIEAEPGAFDIVLMDVQMPGMDGYETTRRLRRIDPAPSSGIHLPIVALTAGALASERTEALKAGMDDFLTKPIDPVQLIRVLRRHVERARGQTLPLVERVRGSSQAPGAPPNAPSWPDIQGLQLESVRERLADDRDLFLSLLDRFFAESHELLAQARQAVETASVPNAAAPLHRLRGQSGNLGATALAETFGQLEQAALDGQLATSAFAAVTTELERLRTEFSAWRARQTQPQAQQTHAQSGESLDATALATFRAQITEQRMEALETFKALAAGLREQLPAEPFAQLEQAMVGLDFPTALTALDALPRPSESQTPVS